VVLVAELGGLRRSRTGKHRRETIYGRELLMSNPDMMPTVVLVHGGFVDGSGWQGVYEHLKKDGYNVAIVQNPTLSLAGDVDATNLIIDAQSEPVILVGHSYGGR
jgi:pimeloyl-ACP methyl ester carboxylesterase